MSIFVFLVVLFLLQNFEDHLFDVVCLKIYFELSILCTIITQYVSIEFKLPNSSIYLPSLVYHYPFNLYVYLTLIII